MQFWSRLLCILTCASLVVHDVQAASIIPSIPYNLTNGTLADATQVMGNFNTIVTDVNANAIGAGANSSITSLSGLTTPLTAAQGGTVVYTGGVGAGTANAQTIAVLVPNNFGLAAGNIVTYIANLTNTTAMTLAVNGTTAKNVYKAKAAGVGALTGGEVISGTEVMLIYDGTEYVLLTPNLGFDGTNFALSGVGSLAFGTAPVLPNGTTATTQSAGDNSTKVATTAYVNSIGSAPAYSSIAGFLPTSIAGTATTGSMTVGTGQAADLGNTVYISKGTTTSWAVSNGNAINGYSGGTTLPNSSTIHMYVCTGGTGTGTYAIPNASYPLAAASCPTGYTTATRRIFSFTTSVAGAPVAYTAVEAEGGSSINYLTTQVLDINAATPGNGSATAYALSVPLGIKLQPLFRTTSTATSAGNFIILSGDETDVAPNPISGGNYYTYWTAAPGDDFGSIGSTGSSYARDGLITTNTSGQIKIRQTATNTATIYEVTRGWKDFRRN